VIIEHLETPQKNDDENTNHLYNPAVIGNNADVSPLNIW